MSNFAVNLLQKTGPAIKEGAKASLQVVQKRALYSAWT